MRAILTFIDSVGDWTGKIACWLSTCLVVLVSAEVIMRYVLNSPTVWNFETSEMVGGTIYVLGWSYAQRRHSHIRLDMIYDRLPLRVRAAVDVIGALFGFFPLMFILMFASISNTYNAWLTGEVGIDSNWYPPIAPFRTVVTIGFILLILQFIAQFIRDSYFVIKNRAL